MKKPVSRLHKRSIRHDPGRSSRSLPFQVGSPKNSELLTPFHILDLQVSLAPNFYNPIGRYRNDMSFNLLDSFKKTQMLIKFYFPKYKIYIFLHVK